MSKSSSQRRVEAGDAIAGRYRLLARLGAGALGEVWAARDAKTDREVALKLLVPAWSIAPRSLEAYFREAKASAKIRHASVLELLDLGEAEIAGQRVPWVALELLEAEKLEELLDRERTLSVGTALRLVSELAWALVAAHEKGIIHERIEPANVLLHRDPRGAGGAKNFEIVPKLVDFGIARLVDELEVLPGTPHEALSPLAYLSPEQIHADVELDGRADVYALGALLHRCLVGSPPFDGDDAATILEQIEAGPTKLEPFEPPLDRKVIHLVNDCLHRNRRLRPTMRVLAERIDALRERFDAQWKAFGAKVRVPRDRTLEHLAALRPPARAEVEDPPLSAQPVSSRDLLEDPPPSSRISLGDDDIEIATPLVPKVPKAPKVPRVASPPPPLPKSTPPPAMKATADDLAPVSRLIREKMKSTASDALALDVLAELENELLKHVAVSRGGGQAADAPAPKPPAGEAKRESARPPPIPKTSSAPPPPIPKTSKMSSTPPPIRKTSSSPPPLPKTVSSPPPLPKTVSSPPPRTSESAKTLPPSSHTVAPARPAASRSYGLAIVVVLAAVAVVAAIVSSREEPTPAAPVAAPPATSTAAPVPTPVPQPVAPEPEPTIVELPTLVELPSASAAATAVVPVPTSVPQPSTPATTAPVVAPAPVVPKEAVAEPVAPKPASEPASTATATATAAPTPTAAAPTATSAKPLPKVDPNAVENMPGF